MLIKKSSGFSLIELMISLAISTLLLASLGSFMISNLQANSLNLKTNKLNQEMRRTIDFIERGIRRAGYFSNTSDTFLASNIYRPTEDCLLFSYDTTNTNNIRAGFKLVDGAIQYRNDTNTTLANPSTCAGGTKWDQLTDSSIVVVDKLKFCYYTDSMTFPSVDTSPTLTTCPVPLSGGTASTWPTSNTPISKIVVYISAHLKLNSTDTDQLNQTYNTVIKIRNTPKSQP